MSVAIKKSAAQKMRGFDAASFQVLVGLDGFVDNIIDVVDKRSDATNYIRVETIAKLGERISRAAGLSSNIELVIKQEKLGGNGPIMANALIQANLPVTYVGNLGRDQVHSVFTDMAARCKACYTLCEPGVTDALEFQDGKLMLGKHQFLKGVTYERMLEVIGLEKLRTIWSHSQLVALTNWTMLPHQTSIWRSLLKDMAQVKVPRGATLFIDLADPEKRLSEEIVDACKLLKNFRATHRVVLGLNQKESIEVSNALGLSLKPNEIEANAARLRKELELDIVVIHPTKNAACATEKTTGYIDGPYCANPKLTTGAGDNFNAGFCLGLLANLEPAELLATGTANSGFYVRNGRSATGKELVGFLEEWSQREGDPTF
jgi:sugar/nucleoside kinase (ribokinase family)